MGYQVCFANDFDNPIKVFATYSEAVEYKHELELIAANEFPEAAGKYSVVVDNNLIPYC